MSEVEDKLWTPNYLKVMTANFAMSFAFYLMTPLLPIYLSEHFGATKDIIGIVLSGYAATVLLVRPFSGYLADSFPRKRVLLISLFFYFICFGGYLVATSIALFAVVRTLHGGPFGAASVANSTMVIDVLPSSRRTEGVGFYGLSNNIATAIAPTVGIMIYQYTDNFNLIFIIALVVAGIGLWADSTIQVTNRQLIQDSKTISLDRFFLLKGWLIGMNMMFLGLCYGVLSNYLAIYGKEVLGITSGTGVFFTLLSLGLITSRLIGAKSLRAGRLVQNMGIGVCVSSVGYILFIASPNAVGYYLSALLIGLGNGHYWPAVQNMIINIANKNERGTATSTLLTSWDLGVGLGALIGGVLAEHLGYQFAFWSVAGLHIFAAMFFFVVMRRDYLRRISANSLS